MNYEELLAILTREADPERAVPMKAYMKHRFDYLGISKPRLAKICKPLFKNAAAEEVDWRFVEQCWANPHRELQYCALEYLKTMQKKLTLQDIPHLKKLITEKSWWDTADVLDRIVGGIALVYPETNAVLLDWSNSGNIWLRRVAIDHQLLRKDKTDTALLEQIICNNLEQKEFFINKAIGWALRDYSKTNPEWVRAFIERYRSRMAKLSIREAEKYV
ncbi:DNA alkylation repair protein [Neisseria wadsworthii]|uniref:DNA alkylation repair protein n=1 Tax=Neisseria wadsworthii TaxID=607711 RepID=UPI000D2FC3ED|nr:DNA alkylation repair protein [Neisseria wadsworthii]